MPATATQSYALTNPISQIVDKSREDFTREDLLRVIVEKQLERITFHYTALDGKYKELQLPIADQRRAERILAEGERVDGSSLFGGLVDSTVSDLYVVPVYGSAFLNPFDSRSLDLTCRFLDADGNLAYFAPDNILHRANRLLASSTGLELRAMGELEFFLLDHSYVPMYPAGRQSGYQQSGPFLKSGAVLDEMARYLEQLTGAVKYAHAEVGTLAPIESEVEELNGQSGEQLEIELLPQPVSTAADTLVMARWIIRNVAYRHGMLATFAPKVEDDVAGNGLHIHMELRRHGGNVMTDGSGLTEDARRAIGGLCAYADTLMAFGNTVASSYLRLVPNHEAPTRVFWSDRNRSAMIRVPLGWSGLQHLAARVNPQQKVPPARMDDCQTVELRTPDGSACVHLLLAGITMAVEWGLTHPESGELAARLYAPATGMRSRDGLPLLPRSCVESSSRLRARRDLYEREGIFPAAVVNYVSELLNREEDDGLMSQLAALPADERRARARRIMHKNLHRH
jgi:glutamine synthetase